MKYFKYFLVHIKSWEFWLSPVIQATGRQVHGRVWGAHDLFNLAKTQSQDPHNGNFNQEGKELDSCKPLTHWIDCICHCTVETTRHWWINFQGCGFESRQTTTIDHKLTADPRICCVILYVLYTK